MAAQNYTYGLTGVLHTFDGTWQQLSANNLAAIAAALQQGVEYDLIVDSDDTWQWSLDEGTTAFTVLSRERRFLNRIDLHKVIYVKGTSADVLEMVIHGSRAGEGSI